MINIVKAPPRLRPPPPPLKAPPPGQRQNRPCNDAVGERPSAKLCQRVTSWSSLIRPSRIISLILSTSNSTSTSQSDSTHGLALSKYKATQQQIGPPPPPKRPPPIRPVLATPRSRPPSPIIRPVLGLSGGGGTAYSPPSLCMGRLCSSSHASKDFVMSI